jgi:hypothetical protein
VATLTVQDIDLDGEGADYVACNAGGDEFVNDGKTFIHVKNTNAATRTVTVNSQRLCDQGFDHDQAVIIPATTGDMMIGPFPTSRFNDVNQKVQLTYSAVTNLTIGVFST